MACFARVFPLTGRFEFAVWEAISHFCLIPGSTEANNASELNLAACKWRRVYGFPHRL